MAIEPDSETMDELQEQLTWYESRGWTANAERIREELDRQQD